MAILGGMGIVYCGTGYLFLMSNSCLLLSDLYSWNTVQLSSIALMGLNSLIRSRFSFATQAVPE